MKPPRKCSTCNRTLSGEEMRCHRSVCYSCNPRRQYALHSDNPLHCEICGRELGRLEYKYHRTKCFECVPLHSHTFQTVLTVVYDPDPYPLCAGLTLPTEEVKHMLRIGSFTPGTQLRDARGNILVYVDGMLAEEEVMV